MATDLDMHIAQMGLVSTHSHLKSEQWWVKQPPDPLIDLFGHYQLDDLVVAGLSRQHVEQLSNPDGDLAERWALVEPCWQAIRHTGYGEKVAIQASELYGLEELTAEGLESARGICADLHRPDQRLRLLRERAGLIGIQVDSHEHPLPVRDDGDGDFVQYDINCSALSNGRVDQLQPFAALDVAVTDLASLDRLCQSAIVNHSRGVVAVKTPHAYNRTLAWERRTDGEAAAALERILRAGEQADPADRLCIGDWLLDRIATLAGQAHLPVKIHTGHAAGVNRMVLPHMSPGLLCPLLRSHLGTTFILMHAGYPFGGELISVAKHYTNVVADLCWAWAVNPLATADILRRFLHAVPANKLLAFGDDTFMPTQAVAYALQARRWLARTLGEELREGLMTEADAIRLADSIGHLNAGEVFRL